jgi:hypothetical protein
MNAPGNKLRALFEEHRDRLSSVRTAAGEAADLIETISPYVESHTAAVCPGCASICCINRHSSYDRSDRIFMAALGRDIPEDSSGLGDTDPCRFLGAKGCSLERSWRPYRCTWFFCAPLLDHISEQSRLSEYRTFLRLLQEITGKRTTMMNECEARMRGINTLLPNA